MAADCRARRSRAIKITLSYSILFGSCCASQKNQKESNDVGKPSKRQIAEAIIQSAKAGESDAEFDARTAGLSRQSDEELAAMGIFPTAEPAPPAEPAATPERAEQDPLAFAPAATRARHDGWTAGRQRAFIAALAETGCVSEACAEVGITPRSA